MQKRVFEGVVVLGLLAILGIGTLHASANPAVLAVCALIALVYLYGGIELLRFRRATASLDTATRALTAPPEDLDAWLQGLDASLRSAVRLRIAGERVALPAPMLPAYLSGVLVLLGMLGTLLGMMMTLRGTGLALETAVDLQAIRDSLAAPVKGLGHAFGTSIAGISGSAALGVLTALCKRERLAVARALDTAIAGPMRGFGRAQREDAVWQQLQAQGMQLPALVAQLQTLAETLDQRDATAREHQQALQQALLNGSEAMQAQQLARQEAFLSRSEAAQLQLANAVQGALVAGIAQAGQAAQALLQPVVEATLGGIAQSARSLHGEVAQALQGQARETGTALQAATASIAQLWTQALAEQRQTGVAMLGDANHAMTQMLAQQEARGRALAETVAAQLQQHIDANAAAWAQALERQQRMQADFTANQQAQLAMQATEQAQAQARQQAALAALIDQQQVAHARQAAEQQAAQGQWVDAFAQQAQHVLAGIERNQQAAQLALQASEAQRQELWREAATALTERLGQQWLAISDASAQRQQQMCDVLQHNAEAIAAQGRQQVEATLAEVRTLLQAASAAPRAAADVIGELRQSLSDSLQRDATMLAERNQLLGTFGTLLETLNHAAGGQQAAIDALVSRAGSLLAQSAERIDTRFNADAERLEAAATRTATGALEIAGIGDAFASAVDAFAASNAQLVERLARLEGALEQSMARSDEQLAYYVAQAREVVDLSLLSQRQIVDDLRRLGESRAGNALESA